jgi:hypothetical protein
MGAVQRSLALPSDPNRAPRFPPTSSIFPQPDRAAHQPADTAGVDAIVM